VGSALTVCSTACDLALEADKITGLAHTAVHATASVSAFVVGGANIISGSVKCYRAFNGQAHWEEKVLGPVQAAGGGLMVAGGALTATIIGAPVGVWLVGAGIVVTVGCDGYRFVVFRDADFGMKVLGVRHQATSEEINLAFEELSRCASNLPRLPNAAEEKARSNAAEQQLAALTRAKDTLLKRAGQSPPPNVEPALAPAAPAKLPSLVLECQRWWWASWGGRPKGWRHEMLETSRSCPYWRPDPKYPDLPQSGSAFLNLTLESYRPQINETTDADGWRYAFNNISCHSWSKDPSGCYVRTRKWVLI